MLSNVTQNRQNTLFTSHPKLKNPNNHPQHRIPNSAIKQNHQTITNHKREIDTQLFSNLLSHFVVRVLQGKYSGNGEDDPVLSETVC